MNKNIEELAYKIKEFLDKHNKSGDTAIYFNNKRLATFEDDKYGEWVLQDGYKGSDYSEYANDDTITMTFEGIDSIYDVVNYGEDDLVFNGLQELFETYGYYYELGNSWNLTLYKI